MTGKFYGGLSLKGVHEKNNKRNIGYSHVWVKLSYQQPFKKEVACFFQDSLEVTQMCASIPRIMRKNFKENNKMHLTSVSLLKGQRN